MAELGALSLRIETTGDKQALRALDAIDAKARKTDISVESTVQALNKLGLSARQVAGNIQVADGQLEQATRIVRGLGSQATVTAGNLAQLGATTQRVAAAQTQQFQVLGRDLVQANGKLSAFGKSGLNAFNALAFGLSQMAATGETSFRSLATSVASVLAFFGPQGAIASAVIATGLVLVDFFKRQKKEVSELAALMKKATDDALARRERDHPVEVAEERLTAAGKAVALAKEEMAALVALGKTRRMSASEELVFGAQLAAQRVKVAAALAQEHEFLRQVNDARAAATKGLKEVKVTTTSLAEAEKERQRVQAAEIDALASLSKSRGTTATELLRLLALEGDLIKELASGHVTKEREAEIWERIAKARAAAATALPALTVRPLTPGTPQAPGTLAKPSGALAQFLSPEQIAADIKRTDAEMAARVAAFNFAETQDALSQSLGNAIGTAIAFGFADGLGRGGIGEGFKQMAAELSMGLGSVAIDYGIKAIAMSQFMGKISAFLIANPLAALGIGIGLVAFGRAIGGRQSGGGRSGGGGFSGAGSGSATQSAEFRRLIFDPGAQLRQQAASGLAGQAAAATPAPTTVIEVIGVTTPRGTELVGAANARYLGRRA